MNDKDPEGFKASDDQAAVENSRVSPILKRVALVLAFAVCVLALIAFLTVVFLPHSEKIWGSEEKAKDLYSQEGNTIQVAFVGSSSTSTGYSPIQLYEEAGIGAFNYGTAHQPLLASYYVIKEIHRLHGDSLTTVVIDPNSLFLSERFTESYPRAAWALAPLALSPVKLEAAGACADQYDGVEVFDLLASVFQYHARWPELESSDYDRAFGVSKDLYCHGQSLIFLSDASRLAADRQRYPDWQITDSIDYDDDQLASLYLPVNYDYLQRIIDYCETNSLNLVFAALPNEEWNDKRHDAVLQIAREYGIPFLDYNEGRILDEIGYVFPLDNSGNHANVHGMQKITGYMGNYLSGLYDFDDARADGRYGYYREDAEKYALDLEDAELNLCTDLEEYLGKLDRDRYTVFIAVRGEAANGLSESVRAKLSDLGLDKLSALEEGQSYAGVIDGGIACKESVSSSPGKKVTLSGSYSDYSVNVKKRQMASNAEIPGEFVITSVGESPSAEASIEVFGEEVSEQKAGINFVVYDRDTEQLVDSSAFDTHGDCARTTDVVSSGYFAACDELREDALSGVSATG